MMNALKRWYDDFRGAGESSISVPPMDGALRSNSKIEAAAKLFDTPTPANLIHDGSEGYFSSGREVFRFGHGQPTPFTICDSVVSAMAVHQGVIAIGLATGGIRLVGGALDGKSFPVKAGFEVNCPVAIAFRDAETLIIANGSSLHGPEDWRHDLLQRNVAGSVWELSLQTGKANRRADGLSWPFGVLPLAGDAILVSDSWKARLLMLRPGKPPEPVLTDLPAYPARLVPTATGQGAWLPLFAPRRRIVELVMRETAFRDRMMAEMPPAHWIAPSLRPMESYYEPLQGGTLKKLAMLKPWAPSRSYGLIVELNGEFQPIRSFHSRADGKRHGISSCAEVDGNLIFAATGGDAILSLALETA